jgi:hypothetical protein
MKKQNTMSEKFKELTATLPNTESLNERESKLLDVMEVMAYEFDCKMQRGESAIKKGEELVERMKNSLSPNNYYHPQSRYLDVKIAWKFFTFLDKVVSWELFFLL